MSSEISRSDAERVVAPLLMKLRARDVLSTAEADVLRDSVGTITEIPAGKTLVRAGVGLSASTLLVEGIVCRYKDLADGQRQIMELHVAGDFVDLHGFLLKQLDHNIGSMTAVTVATFPHERLKVITETQPHLARMLWFSTLLDAAIHREKILSIGRRSAHARIAHILCELFIRLQIVGLASEDGYSLPLTQSDLADVTGLTSVHVNRMLKKLREEGVIVFRGGEVEVKDWDALQQVAEFDPSYLHLERRPR